MDDSSESLQWLLLIHQLPTKPDYLRVKVRRRLQRLGAVALKNTVYVLPARAETIEDFEWLRREIEDDGGDATVAAATLVAGQTDEELASLFRADRDAAYAEIARAARSAVDHEASQPADVRAEAARLRRRLADVTRTDFFDAAGRADAEAAVDELEAHAAGAPAGAASVGGTREGADLRGRTWVTREGVFVDRIGSAWLIRRFIDAAATFKFVAGRAYRARAGELRFDMYHGEFTHEGERCTFETLLARFGLEGDPALAAIGEIVHDIDLKDEKFGRTEAPGVAAVLEGIARSHADDVERIRLGGAVFDGLYAQLGGSRAGATRA